MKIAGLEDGDKGTEKRGRGSQEVERYNPTAALLILLLHKRLD